MFRRAKSVVGLDIGSSAIKVVELKSSGSGHRVVAFGVQPVPPDSIVEGAIVDGPGVAGAIRTLFATARIKTKDVVASVSGNAVIVKKISVPVMNDAELADSIHWEAEQYIPFDIQDVALDYQVLDPAGAAGRSAMDVLLVAAKREKIADYMAVIAQAGRVPVIVDVDAFALQNAYEVNYGFEPGMIVALLNMGASAININILAGDQSAFTRDISMGGNAYTEALQKDLSISQQEAEALKRGEAVEGLDFEEARPILRSVTDSVLLEIQKTFDFFKATAATERLDKLMISGGASRVDGLTDALAERFEAPVEALNPFRRVIFDANKFGFLDASEVAPVAAVAVGLALRRAGDR